MNDLDKYINENDISNLQELYQDNPLISYALKQCYNINNNIDNKNIEKLSSEQIKYIEMLSDNKPISEICHILCISKPLIIIWQKTNKLFNECIKIVKECQAEQAEAILWNNAINSESADSISRMFALKARKPEYRDNAIIPNNNIISLKISVDGQLIDTSQSIKTIEEE